MDNIAEVDPNATLLRVRQVMMRDDADFLLGLSHAELADMVLCACANLSVLRRLGGVTARAVDALVNTPVEER